MRNTGYKSAAEPAPIPALLKPFLAISTNLDGLLDAPTTALKGLSRELSSLATDQSSYLSADDAIAVFPNPEDFRLCLRRLRWSIYGDLATSREGRALLRIVAKLHSKLRFLPLFWSKESGVRADLTNSTALLAAAGKLRAASRSSSASPERCAREIIQACGACIELAYSKHVVPLLWGASNLLLSESKPMPRQPGNAVAQLRNRFPGPMTLVRPDLIQIRNASAHQTYDWDPVAEACLLHANDEELRFLPAELAQLGVFAVRLKNLSDNILTWYGLSQLEAAPTAVWDMAWHAQCASLRGDWTCFSDIVARLGRSFDAQLRRLVRSAN